MVTRGTGGEKVPSATRGTSATPGEPGGTGMPGATDANEAAGLSVRRAAAEAGERLALVSGDRSWTWVEAAEEANRALVSVRAAVARAGVAPAAVAPASGPVAAPIIAFDARPTPRVVFTVFALIEAGQPFVPLDPRLPAAERGLRIARINACVDLDDAAAAATMGATEAAGEGGDCGPGDIPADRPLALLFSSGSTGAARLVELSRGAFAASAAASGDRLGWQDDDRWLCCLPLAHVGGLSILSRCLLSRRTIVLTDGFVAADVAGTMLDHEVTLASLVPTMLVRLLDLEPPWRPPANLRAILLGGAPAGADLWRRIEARGLPVRATYGMTETCSQVATAEADAPSRLVPLVGAEFRERAGRIEVRGPTLCTSIDGVAAPAGPDWTEDGFLRTGDLGRVRGDGAIEISGRADRLIVTGGENVAPAEVEAVLEAHPGVARALVFGVEDPEWGEVIAAALVSASEPPTHADLASWCAARLPTYARPRRVAWFTEIPSTAAGKPDVVAARDAARPRLEAL